MKLDFSLINMASLARQSGVSRATLDRVFRQKYMPRVESARRLAATLEVSLDELMVALDEWCQE
jgi:transcriptional regulator with XRE-family HTH domain